MTLTQSELIKEIADREDIDVATVHDIFRMAENIIIDYLSSTTPSDSISIKPLKGLTIKGEYVPEKIYSKGMFKDTICPEHIKVKANLSKYFRKKVGDEFYR